MRIITKPVFLSFCALICFINEGAAKNKSGKRTIHVLVGLCDNETQGIVKVNPRIGDGNDLDHNLYWGCSDGLRSLFKKSSRWKLTKSEKDLSPRILERLTFQHTSIPEVTLIADAYRGSEMKQCLLDFMKALGSTENPEVKLVAFIGHNGLMDHPNVETPLLQAERDTMVLSCLSDSWFSERLESLGATPVLMTRSLMYPGSFIFHDALEGWLRGETRAKIKERAARAYARNQKISLRAGRSIFAD